LLATSYLLVKVEPEDDTYKDGVDSGPNKKPGRSRDLTDEQSDTKEELDPEKFHGIACIN